MECHSDCGGELVDGTGGQLDCKNVQTAVVIEVIEASSASGCKIAAENRVAAASAVSDGDARM